MDLTNLDRQIVRSRRFAVGIMLLAGVAYGAWFVAHGADLSTNPNDWGTFGDFIGGVVNPLIAFMAFYWLTASVRLQKEELASTRAELAKTSEAQRDAAEHALHAAQLAALNTELSALSAEISSLREDRRFLAEQLRDGNQANFVLIDGIRTGLPENVISQIHAFEDELDTLVDKRNLVLQEVNSVLRGLSSQIPNGVGLAETT